MQSNGKNRRECMSSKLTLLLSSKQVTVYMETNLDSSLKAWKIFVTNCSNAVVMLTTHSCNTFLVSFSLSLFFLLVIETINF